MDDADEKDRAHYVQAREKSMEAYDKALLSLSGGALGISLVFIRDVLQDGAMVHPRFLPTAWLCWAGTLTVTLVSFYVSHLALGVAITQTDNDRSGEKPGGWLTTVTDGLNIFSGILFLSGLFFFLFFAISNLR